MNLFEQLSLTSKTGDRPSLELAVESLEERMMLSTVDIIAAGSENTETMQLQIDGSTVRTWNNISGNDNAEQYTTYRWQTANNINADQVRVALVNSIYDPANGFDENLRIDAIVIDGVRFETEDPSVFSTGTWKPADGIVAGNRESEFLHADGYFQYADQNTNGTEIVVNARGTTGQETFEVQIDGQTVRTFNNVSTSISSYRFTVPENVTADQVRIAFTNDVYDPANGIDRNLFVDDIVVGGQRYETEAPSVFSTGTWLPADGVAPGFRQSETLHSNGYFQFAADSNSNPGQVSLAASQYTVGEESNRVQIRFNRTGGSDGAASIFFQTVNGTASSNDYSGTNSRRVDFADGQTTATANITITNDTRFEGAETFTVSLFRAEGTDLGDPRTATVTIADDESNDNLVGYWKLDESSIGQPVIDSSGEGNNGTHRNIASSAVSSNSPDFETINDPRSVQFDGANDFVDVPADAALDLSNGRFTQSVWIRPTNNNGAYQGVLGFQNSSGSQSRYPGIWIRGTTVHAGFGDGTNWNNVTTGGGKIAYNQWNHIATTFDGTSFRIFVNGVQALATNDFAGRTPTAVSQLTIGKVDNFFTGNIDEVRIYKRALTGTEITGLIDGATVPTQTFNEEFQREVIASGFVKPIAIEFLPNGRALVAEQDGLIKVIEANGTVRSQALLDIKSIVNSGTKDRGLLGFTIHPDFANNPYIYVSYTYDPPEVNSRTGLGGPDGNGARVSRISRFTVNAAGTIADPSSNVVLVGNNSTYQNIGTPNSRPGLNDPHSCFDAGGNPIDDCIPSDETSHTIGDLEFGPDGYLYASTGDGGSFGRADPVNLRSLDIDSLAGKILRIDPLTGRGLSDNPFFDGNVNSNQSKVYSYGLRNPFRIAVNQVNGEVYAGDVGWTKWEEINTGRGANFGWPAFEGGSNGTSERTGRYQDLAEVQSYYATNPDVTAPIYARLHSDGGRAIVMGDFLYGSQYGSLEGGLLFTDIGDQILRVAKFGNNGQITDVQTVSSAVGFIVDVQSRDNGDLYYTDLVSGEVGILRFS